MTVGVISRDEVIAAADRIAASDAARAWHLALAVTAGDEPQARQLLIEATEHADALVADPQFQAAAQRIAREILRLGEQSGETIERLYQHG